MRRYSYPFFAPPGRPPGPYLPITITNPRTKRNILWYCLADTGADTCLFSGGIAAMLGHNLKGNGVKSTITTGVEGREVRTWMHTFSLKLMHPASLERTVWISRKSLFECIDHDACPQLLGVKEFLRHFCITLDYLNEMTIMQWED